jgi:hypothetical protein
MGLIILTTVKLYWPFQFPFVIWHEEYIFHRMSHEKLSAGERRKARKIYCKSLYKDCRKVLKIAGARRKAGRIQITVEKVPCTYVQRTNERTNATNAP